VYREKTEMDGVMSMVEEDEGGVGVLSPETLR
jgi:hypothetical protein